MHEYTCAVVSVLILWFFLVLRIFWEEQLAEQFWYFNFSLYSVVFWAEQLKKSTLYLLTTGRLVAIQKFSRKCAIKLRFYPDN